MPFESDKTPVKTPPSTETKFPAVPVTLKSPKFAVLEKLPVAETGADAIESCPENVADPLVGKVEGSVKPIFFQYAMVFGVVAPVPPPLHAMRKMHGNKTPKNPICFNIITIAYIGLIKEIENFTMRHAAKLNSVRSRKDLAKFLNPFYAPLLDREVCSMVKNLEVLAAVSVDCLGIRLSISHPDRCEHFLFPSFSDVVVSISKALYPSFNVTGEDLLEKAMDDIARTNTISNETRVILIREFQTNQSARLIDGCVDCEKVLLSPYSAIAQSWRLGRVSARSIGFNVPRARYSPNMD